MAKQITFEYDGIPYTLEFTRNSVRRMERNGFDIERAKSAPISAVYDLLDGALYAHHRNVDKRKVEAIFNQLDDLSGWGEDLIEMYTDTFDTTQDGAGEIKRAKNW